MITLYKSPGTPDCPKFRSNTLKGRVVLGLKGGQPSVAASTDFIPIIRKVMKRKQDESANPSYERWRDISSDEILNVVQALGDLQ